MHFLHLDLDPFALIDASLITRITTKCSLVFDECSGVGTYVAPKNLGAKRARTNSDGGIGFGGNAQERAFLG